MSGEGALAGAPTTAVARRAYHGERPDVELGALLDELEREARNRACALAAARRLTPELAGLYRASLAEERESRRLLAALLAARSAAAFAALARGRPVPESLLDPSLVSEVGGA